MIRRCRNDIYPHLTNPLIRMEKIERKLCENATNSPKHSPVRIIPKYAKIKSTGLPKPPIRLESCMTSNDENVTNVPKSNNQNTNCHQLKLPHNIDTNYLNYIEMKEENITLKEQILKLKTTLAKQDLEIQKLNASTNLEYCSTKNAASRLVADTPNRTSRDENSKFDINGTYFKGGEMANLYQRHVNSLRDNSLICKHIYDPLVSKSELNQMYRTSVCYLTHLNQSQENDKNINKIAFQKSLNSSVPPNEAGSISRTTLIKLAAEKKFMEVEALRKFCFSQESEIECLKVRLGEGQTTRDELSQKLDKVEAQNLTTDLHCQLLRQINFLLNISLALRELQQTNSSNGSLETHLPNSFNVNDDSFYNTGGHELRSDSNKNTTAYPTDNIAQENLRAVIDFLEKKTIDFVSTTKINFSDIRDHRILQIFNHIQNYRKNDVSNCKSKKYSATDESINISQTNGNYLRDKDCHENANRHCSPYFYNSNSLGSSTDSSSSGVSSTCEPNLNTKINCFSPLSPLTQQPLAPFELANASKFNFYRYSETLIQHVIDLLKERLLVTNVTSAGPSNPIVKALFECFEKPNENCKPDIYPYEHANFKNRSNGEFEYARSALNGWIDNLLLDMDYTRYTTTIGKMGQNICFPSNSPSSSTALSELDETKAKLNEQEDLNRQIIMENAITMTELGTLKEEYQYMSEEKYYAQREKCLTEFRISIKDSIEQALKSHLRNLEAEIANFQMWANENLDPKSMASKSLTESCVYGERINHLVNTLQNVYADSEHWHTEAMQMVYDLKNINSILINREFSSLKNASPYDTSEPISITDSESYLP